MKLTMHYKRFLLFFALFGLVSLTFAEKYNVLHVKGSIRLETTKTALKPGDVIDSEDKVIFGSADCVAALFSPAKGRFTLSPQKKGADFGEEFVAYVKANLFPAKKGLSTRAAGILKNELELKQHFEREDYLILGATKVRVSNELYPQNESAFFYLRLNLGDDSEEVNKKLSSDGDQIVLSAAQILQVDQTPIKPYEVEGYSLFYYDAKATMSQKICEFEPVFPDEEALKSSVQMLADALSLEKKSEEEIREEIDGFVSEYYGNADPETLTEWLSVNISY